MEWLQLIGTYGFPIIACAYLFYSTEKQRNKDREEMQKEREVIRAENISERDKDRAERVEQDKRYDAIAINITQLCEAINNNTKTLNENTQAIQQLINKE